MTGLVNRYVGLLPGGPNQEAYKAAWRKVHDVMGIGAIEELTVEQLPRAVVFVQSLIDSAAAIDGEGQGRALPPASLETDLDFKLRRLRAIKQEMMDLTAEIYHVAKRSIQPRMTEFGRPAFSHLVNLNYVVEDVLYGLDRNLDALEHLCVAGELAVKVFSTHIE